VSTDEENTKRKSDDCVIKSFFCDNTCPVSSFFLLFIKDEAHFRWSYNILDIDVAVLRLFESIGFSTLDEFFFLHQVLFRHKWTDGVKPLLCVMNLCFSFKDVPFK
jgi:hypothetical protein